MIPRLVIAGVSSGCGKTTSSVGLIRALRQRGLKVAPFKCGPDYLDPTYLERAAGVPAHNLDGWMMGRDGVLSTFEYASRGADIAVIEGMMGLFDGASATGEEGSTAEIAKWLGAPVLLAVDASAMARTIAAVAHGFKTFDPELRLAGLIANGVGGPGHLELLRRAAHPMAVVGGLPQHPELAFPERHLGLLTASRETVAESQFTAWGELTATSFDLESVLAIARTAGELPNVAQQTVAKRPARCRIGIAFDDAFHFYYADNLRRLELAGAELVRFSPVADTALPQVGGLYFGGGYPEVYAAQLAANESMRAAVRDFAARGRPIYAECGGLMYLASAIRTAEGQEYPMAGLLPLTAVMSTRLRAIGYVSVETREATLLGPAGTIFRGHQFRYSEPQLLEDNPRRAYSVQNYYTQTSQPEGYRGESPNVLASYVHAHWASNPEIPEAFVVACAARGSAC